MAEWSRESLLTVVSNQRFVSGVFFIFGLACYHCAKAGELTVNATCVPVNVCDLPSDHQLSVANLMGRLVSHVHHMLHSVCVIVPPDQRCHAACITTVSCVSITGVSANHIACSKHFTTHQDWWLEETKVWAFSVRYTGGSKTLQEQTLGTHKHTARHHAAALRQK